VVVSCLPLDIPEHIELDVDELMLHQGIRLRDVATNPKWKAVTGSRLDAGPRDHAEGRGSGSPGGCDGGAVAAVATTPAEPEVIKKGKKETEEGAAAPAKDEKKK
jgi:large subunit ribosomal protein L25